MLAPTRRQPFVQRRLLKLHLEIHGLVFAGAGRTLGANKSVRSRSGCEIELVKREERFSDQQMGVAQREIGDEGALHRAAGRAILEIAAMRRDEETRAEEPAFLVSESPGHLR